MQLFFFFYFFIFFFLPNNPEILFPCIFTVIDNSLGGIKFGYNETEQKYGYYVTDSEGADTFNPFSGCEILIAKSGGNCTTGESIIGYSEYIVLSVGANSRVTDFSVTNGTKTLLFSGTEFAGSKTTVYKIIPTQKDINVEIKYSNGIECCFIIGY